MSIEILADAEAVACAAAERVRAAAAAAIARGGRFRLALSGGRTPERLYRLLGQDRALPWSHIEIYFADERAVPADHRDSNFRMVNEALIAPLGAGAPRVHRMRGEAPELETAAREYESMLKEPLDLLLLGIGDDGHVASLFPGAAGLREPERRVIAVYDSPKPPARRITITPCVVREAREVWVLATGAEKASAVARALADEGDLGACPARLARGGLWLVDREAAGARAADL